jgi:TolB protein
MSDRDGDIEVYVMDADGKNAARLTNSPGFDGYPSWSPDGSKIAFISGRDDNAEIYLMNSDGSDQTNLTSNLP